MITISVSSDTFLVVVSLVVLETLFVGQLLVRWLLSWRTRRVKQGEQSDAIANLEKQVLKTQHQLKELTYHNNQRSNYINSIFATMEDGVLVVNDRFEILLVNPSGRVHLEVSNDIFFREVTMKEEATLLSKTLAGCKDTLTSLESCVLLFSDGVRHFEIKTSIIYNRYAKQEIIGVLAIVKDVTEIRKIEALRKEFVANVSHEFRTPITLISGFIEMLKLHEGISLEERRRALEIIEIESERLKRLISELLTLSQIESTLNKEDQSFIDIEEVIEQSGTALSFLLEQKSIVFSCDIDLDYPLLKGNENFFYQAIFNVIENAIKYTPTNGTIALTSYVVNEYIYIEVKDNGIGIPKEEIDRIFERFYRVDQARSSQSGGSGIGLAIVKNIVEMFHGVIKVESEVGCGTTFTLCFPISEE